HTVSRTTSSRTSEAKSSIVTKRLTQNERFTPNGIASNLLLFGSAHGQSAYHVAADEHCEDGHRQHDHRPGRHDLSPRQLVARHEVRGDHRCGLESLARNQHERIEQLVPGE